MIDYTFFNKKYLIRMFDKIIEINNKFNSKYISDNKYSNIILQIYNSENISIDEFDQSDPIILNIIANYYSHIKENKKESIKYLLEAIKKNHIDSILDLAELYKTTKDYELEKKCLFDGLEKNKENTNILRKIAEYYLEIEKDKAQTELYYLMILDICTKTNTINPEILYDIGDFYYYDLDQEDTGIKYFEMSCEYDDIEILLKVASSYWIGPGKKKKYLLKAAELNSAEAMYKLGCFYCPFKEDEDRGYFLLRRQENNPSAMESFWNMAIYKGYTKAYLSFAKYYQKIDDINKFLFYCDKAIEFKHYDIYLELIEYYNSIKNYDKMLEICNKGIELNICDINIIYIKLLAYYKNINDIENFKLYFEKLSNKQNIHLYSSYKFFIKIFFNFVKDDCEYVKNIFKNYVKNTSFIETRTFYDFVNDIKGIKNDLELIKICLLDAINNNDNILNLETYLLVLVKIFKKQNDFDSAINLILKHNDYSNDNLIEQICLLYTQKQDFANMEIFLKNGIEQHNNTKCIKEYAKYLIKIKNYDLAKKYLLESIEKYHDLESMYLLGIYWIEVENDYVNMNKYFKLGDDKTDNYDRNRKGYTKIKEKSLGKIKTLNISNSKIEGVLDLEYFNNLIELDCSNNSITEIINIPSKLKSLNCSNNQITNLDVLDNCKKMEKLNCTKNKIKSIIYPFDSRPNKYPSNLKNIKFKSIGKFNLDNLPDKIKNVEFLIKENKKRLGKKKINKKSIKRAYKSDDSDNSSDSNNPDESKNSDNVNILNDSSDSDSDLESDNFQPNNNDIDKDERIEIDNEIFDYYKDNLEFERKKNLIFVKELNDLGKLRRMIKNFESYTKSKKPKRNLIKMLKKSKKICISDEESDKSNDESNSSSSSESEPYSESDSDDSTYNDILSDLSFILIDYNNSYSQILIRNHRDRFILVQNYVGLTNLLSILDVKELFIDCCDLKKTIISEFPSSLESLVFSNKLQSQIDWSNEKLKYIKKIKFSNKYNKNLNNLPPKLETLILGDEFDSEINKLPKSLRYLYLGDKFNKKIILPKELGCIRLPNTLDIIDILFYGVKNICYDKTTYNIIYFNDDYENYDLENFDNKDNILFYIKSNEDVEKFKNIIKTNKKIIKSNKKSNGIFQSYLDNNDFIKIINLEYKNDYFKLEFLINSESNYREKKYLISHIDIKKILEKINIKSIIIDDDYSDKINFLPKNLEYLDLGYNFNGEIIGFPKKLIYLKLSNNSDINIEELPDTIEYILLGLGYKNQINKLPNNLKHIWTNRTNIQIEKINSLNLKSIFFPVYNVKNSEKLDNLIGDNSDDLEVIKYIEIPIDIKKLNYTFNYEFTPLKI